MTTLTSRIPSQNISSCEAYDTFSLRTARKFATHGHRSGTGVRHIGVVTTANMSLTCVALRRSVESKVLDGTISTKRAPHDSGRLGSDGARFRYASSAQAVSIRVGLGPGD